MSFNIELKARCADLEAFEKKTKNLDHTFDGLDKQVDTFYNVPKGRLKLRESSLYGNFLIPYLRADDSGPKRSDYSLLPVPDVAATKRILEDMFGPQLIVKKIRKIYLFENVRIHLDRIEGLGQFIEFEAVVENESEINSNREKLDQLIKYFGINELDFVSNAYADLILGNST